MSVTVDWMNANYNLVHINFNDDWIWKEFYTALLLAQNLISKSSGEVSFLLDLLGSNLVNSPNAIPKNLQILPSQKPKRLIIVTEQAHLMTQLYPVIQLLYPNLDEVRIISSDRVTLTNYHQQQKYLHLFNDRWVSG